MRRIYRDLYGDATLVPIWMGTNVAAGNQQKHLLLMSVTGFCYKCVNLSLEKLKNIKFILFFLIQELLAKFPEMSNFFNQNDSSLGRHENAA